MYANFEYKYLTIFTQSRFLYYAKTVLLITITLVHGTQAENIMKCPLCHKNSNIWLFVTNTKSQITFYLITTLPAAYWLCLWCLAALHKNPSKTNSTNTEFRNDFSQFVFQCHFHGFPSTGLIYPHSSLSTTLHHHRTKIINFCIQKFQLRSMIRAEVQCKIFATEQEPCILCVYNVLVSFILIAEMYKILQISCLSLYFICSSAVS